MPSWDRDLNLFLAPLKRNTAVRNVVIRASPMAKYRVSVQMESLECPHCHEIFTVVKLNQYGEVWMATCKCGYFVIDKEKHDPD
jgi:hypothetical protein